MMKSRISPTAGAAMAHPARLDDKRREGVAAIGPLPDGLLGSGLGGGGRRAPTRHAGLTPLILSFQLKGLRARTAARLTGGRSPGCPRCPRRSRRPPCRAPSARPTVGDVARCLLEDPALHHVARRHRPEHPLLLGELVEDLHRLAGRIVLARLRRRPGGRDQPDPVGEGREALVLHPDRPNVIASLTWNADTGHGTSSSSAPATTSSSFR